MVQGSLRSREYESDGVQRRIFELRADTVAKLDRAERREEEAASSDIRQCSRGPQQRRGPLRLESRMVSFKTIIGAQRRERLMINN